MRSTVCKWTYLGARYVSPPHAATASLSCCSVAACAGQHSALALSRRSPLATNRTCFGDVTFGSLVSYSSSVTLSWLNGFGNAVDTLTCQQHSMDMNLRAQAYDAFTRHLLERRLVPGQFVTQRDLAALVGFPLGAIREMIPRLEAEGLVHTLAQRGLQIMGADPRLIRYAFQLRDMIESEAITHYVRTASDGAVAQDVAALADVLAKARSGQIDAGLVARAQAVDWGFHDRIVESLGNPLLNDVHRVNAIRIRLMMYDRVTLTPEILAPALEEHRPVLDAVQRRDVKLALKALKSHLASARRRALGLEKGLP